MTDPIPARVAALKTMPMPDLKAQWREVFETEPPPFNRRHLENRIAYRIQELAYGGLKPETIRRLEILGEQYDSDNVTTRRIRHDARPVAGTRLVREYRGVEHIVTVRADGYEWEGRPYRSLSAIARAITGTRWNGLVFFGAQAAGERGMTKPITRKLRCAVYTRKSSEEGLEQEFNSLHAQREACEAYVAQQRSEGWALIREPYDDGGFSGGTLERPALKRLLADIEEGLIDVVVVYKIDRLSRSLMDFSKLVEVFDRAGVTFVSVTQSFNTTTSMGRLTLNILLSFAQFEREVTAERIRDKIRASRQKGMFMGGNVPLGYVVKDRKLVVEEADGRDRPIASSSGSSGSARPRCWRGSCGAEGVRTKRGKLVDKGYLYKLLNNRDLPRHGGAQGHGVRGRARRDHRSGPLGQGARDPRRERPHPVGQHPGADAGAAEGADLRADRRGHVADAHAEGQPALPLLRQPGRAEARADACPVGRVPAAEIEAAVIDQLRGIFRQPEIIVGTWRAARAEQDDITEDEAREALLQLDPLWDELFPAEQARIVQLLVERVDVRMHGVEVRLRPNGLAGLVREVAGSRRAAA